MSETVIFDPLLPWPVLWGAVALGVAFTLLAVWRGLSGWWLRGLAALLLLAALVWAGVAMFVSLLGAPS